MVFAALVALRGGGESEVWRPDTVFMGLPDALRGAAEKDGVSNESITMPGNA